MDGYVWIWMELTDMMDVAGYGCNRMDTVDMMDMHGGEGYGWI